MSRCLDRVQGLTYHRFGADNREDIIMRLSLFATLVALMLVGFSTSAHAQSLGDIAKREAERRKSVKDDGKVLTNKDVPRVIPSSAPAPTPAAEPSDADKSTAAAGDKPAEPGQKDAKETADEPKDQKYWSERQRLLQDQLDRDETFLQAVQTRVNALTTDFVNRDDPAQRSVIAADRQKALEDVTRLNAAIVADKKAVADLEEEAHRAGVPPGWLR